MVKYRIDIHSVSAVFKALSDESRLRAFIALRHHELCVCQIIELLQLAPSTVSKHMSILKQAGLVESRKKGRWIHYHIAKNMFDERDFLIKWLAEILVDDETINKDHAAINHILEIDPEELCRKQCQK